MSDRPFRDPVPRVVTDGEFNLGCYTKPFQLTNMLDVERPYRYRLPRLIKYFRLKEWVAFYLGDSRHFFMTTLYDAKSAAIAIFQGYDRQTKRSFGFRHLIPGGILRFGPSLDGTRLAFHGGRDFLDYHVKLSEGVIGVRVGHRGGRSSPSFSGSMTLTWNDRQTAMESVCLPLGLNRAMYTTKALMPLNGRFRIDKETFDFSGSDAMGVLDDHKGYYPYRLRYDWVAGFGLDGKGRRVGFNLVDNQVRDPEKDNENCMWIGGRTFSLPPVRVTRPRGVYEEWIIQDTEGLVDLTFQPETRNDLRINLLFARSDYSGPFGTFKGFVRNGEGERIDASMVYGIGEKKYLRA
jgi:hypothetical protein